ncbi:tRNA preQ1(34) S-adenosylmethionine ribosyltransferase-isomerase QueA [Helicobacter suis]|nr:tRNA preQ1(34) S-adenosylmethionine ribosyltransferase-isomerase QueA [Helicobacter suis]BCD46382.1 S-adenosylmethionine:tRNA ribosyltransferase-isomerase QueA [Helicobacter suis]BCD47708.1 S-adenosylmethionine:tRNA ribosyltransferase-isomerase QueA [Helicobacter suis]BCD49463.1 S-adenosylmethionine:tRNA ribosyltransferase-isomerase QueA [Helicobacter suis]BCD51499.1 S-adenosylmethionine:tRNA ribosyltransferase-isomerase QueA [Helicobacter suis]BDR28770.1 S-adenosylmethionine:tRNA ribosyltr
MSIPKEFLRASYTYHLPKHLIASHPIKPKEEAKLMIYERARNRLTHTTFAHIFEFFPKNALIVLNDTKVIKARLFGRKKSGHLVEILIHHPKDNFCLVQIRGKVHVGLILQLDHGYFCQVLEVLSNGMRLVGFFKESGHFLEWVEVLDMLEILGHMPIPPYLKRADEIKDLQDYQSVFAKNLGAIAAPTASLHFSESTKAYLLSHFKHAFLTLHVGAGTFLGVECEDIREHGMHSEFVDIPLITQQALDHAPCILCIGTTALRAVEHYKRGFKTPHCNLFLHAGNPVKHVQALLTNFHLPQSTLIMLVASMLGLDKCLELYKQAIKHHYRFYSYGDGMLIL